MIYNNPIFRSKEKIPHIFLFEASEIAVGSASVIVLLRCLIDIGSVKSDSLFCSVFGDLPCHVSPCFEKQVVYPNIRWTLGDNTPLRWWDSSLWKVKGDGDGSFRDPSAAEVYHSHFVSKLSKRKKRENRWGVKDFFFLMWAGSFSWFNCSKFKMLLCLIGLSVGHFQQLLDGLHFKLVHDC